VGEVDEGKVGKEEKGYVGDAANDTDLETERTRSWMEEVAEISFYTSICIWNIGEYCISSQNTHSMVHGVTTSLLGRPLYKC